MSSAVKPIPDGHHTITPHLVIRGLAEAIPFYEKALGAVEIYRMPMPDGTVGHAEIRIGNSIVDLGAQAPDWEALSPSTLGGSGVTIPMYVEDADALFAQAVEAGATVKMPMMDAPWGRSLRQADRPVRARVVARDPQGRPDARRDHESDDDLDVSREC